MFAKQKSCTIIDVEKRIFFSGVSDEQEKSYELSNIWYLLVLNIKYFLKPLILIVNTKCYTFLKMGDQVWSNSAVINMKN